jgi:hypothetical protein
VGLRLANFRSPESFLGGFFAVVGLALADAPVLGYKLADRH